ncbi:protein unc-50 homolog [Salvia splendens]|uniref:protein unc-50 homolog n=1 Tax=Salvia splendens TaxID=180675 RepID=UPI001C268078|nr:protein unc-50 homolog [Salvia splendens]XP_041995344.1 protein unc-50 homolog [Salvia splendens]
MDIEYTFWQMLNLCTSPKVVYQHTKYHKQTKNQWARDDPAFIVICSLLFSVSLIAYCAAFFTNNYLREEAPHSYVVEQRVEWLYAFDVHCNFFFPMFVLLYVLHYFLSPLLVAHGFIPLLLSNVLFMVAVSYYHYLNYLGYDVLPFLVRTTVFLYPIGVVLVLSPILCLSGFNPSRYFMNIYFSQRQYIS